MAKIAYNACYGGFALSEKAIHRYAEIKGLALYPEGDRHSKVYWLVPADKRSGKWLKGEVLYDTEIERHDPALVQAIEELGDEASGMCARLRLEEVPDGTFYRLSEHDGYERVETCDMNDWRVAGTK